MQSQMNVSPGSLAFSSNRSIPQSIAPSLGAPGSFHFSKSLNLFAFGTFYGTLIFSSQNFEFELEVSSSHKCITNVLVSDSYGTTFYLTESGDLGVVDIFREIEGVRISPNTLVSLSSRARCFCLTSLPPSNSSVLLFGTDTGKIMMLDITASAAMDTPRYIPSLYVDLGSPAVPITTITTCNDTHVLVGLGDGSVKIIRMEGRKIVATTQKTSCGVVHIHPVSSPTTPSFITAYENGSVCSFELNTCVATGHFSGQISRFFATSVRPEHSPLIGLLADNHLVRLDGPKWDHESTLHTCVSILPISDSSFFSLEYDSHEISSLVTRTFASKTNPLAPLTVSPSCIFGSLSLGRFSSREPAISISISRQNHKFEPNIIRLGNILTKQPLAGTERFLSHTWNAGLWEGMIVSAFNSPPELAFTIYSHTSSFLLGSVALTIPNFSIITAMDVRCDSSDRWSILLGFSSGRIGLVESYLDFPNPELVWRSHLLPSNGVHEGNKICRLDRTLMDGRIVMAVDCEGLCSFTRMTSDLVDEEDETNASVVQPDHVVMTGENGTVFVDAKSNSAYACMSDGTVERIKTPRIRKSTGIVDMFDAENWDTVGVVEGGFPLNGKFVNLYPSFGIAVRETGIVLMAFPTKHVLFGGRVTKIIRVSSRIIDSAVHLIGARCYLVILTDTNTLQVFETSADGIQIFERNFPELKKFDNRVNKSLIVTPSMHLFDFGRSVTSLLFSDRMKDVQSIEPIIASAQRSFGFPKIKSVPLPEYGTTPPTTASVPRENTSSSSSSSNPSKQRKNLFSKIFSRSKKSEEKKELPIASKFQPTEFQLKEARDQLAKNLEKMAKLQDDTDEMQMASEEFLKSCNELSETFDSGKKGKKFFGMRF